jgi:hypothetical protein
MKAVENLCGLREEFRSRIPDPSGSIAQDHRTDGFAETTTRRFALDARREVRQVRAGVRRGCAFHACRIGDRPRIAHRCAFLIARFGRPNGDQLGFASFRRAVGLLARALDHFFSAHGHARGIHSQVHGGSHLAHPFQVLAFIHRDLRAQRFRSSFHLLRAHCNSRQIVQ